MKFNQVDFIPAEGAKIVEYLGIHVSLPNHCNYIATDASGDVFAYVDEPTVCIHFDEWRDYENGAPFLGNFKFTIENWKETLQEYM